MNQETFEELKIRIKGVSKLKAALKTTISKCAKIEHRSKKYDAIICLLARIRCNLEAIYTLDIISLKVRNAYYLKLPTGLLIRSCLLDTLTALFVSSLKKTSC